jgi:hypothetical protein
VGKGYFFERAKKFKIATPPFNNLDFFFRGQFFFFGFSFAWLIGPGIFRGSCPLGNFLILILFQQLLSDKIFLEQEKN